jgi:hypothetical protein
MDYNLNYVVNKQDEKSDLRYTFKIFIINRVEFEFLVFNLYLCI